MASQQHLILRQVLEVGGCAPADAQRVQSVLRDIYYQRLVPAIERACSELSVPGRVQRIDRMEVDLGEAPLEGLGPAMADAFDHAFPDALAAALGAVASEGANAELELFSYFIRTGTVPWWADRSDRGLLDANLSSLIDNAPAALRRAILSAPAQETVWRRIVIAHSDRRLEALTSVLAWPRSVSYAGVGSQWLALVGIAAGAQGAPTPLARNVWWEELLRAVGAGDALSEGSRVVGAILLQLAHRLRIAYRPLIADLLRALDRGDVSMPSSAHEAVESLHQEELREEARGNDAVATPRGELARLLAQLESPGGLDGVVRVRLSAAIGRLPSGERAEAEALFRSAPKDTQRARLEELGAKLAQSGALRQRDGDGLLRSHVDLRFSDVDELYVENAGLVILWPFLATFFAQLDLIVGKHFKDAAAQQRAIGLLQHLATETSTSPEFLVPLNKVLCGSAPDDVFDFGPPITEVEVEACGDLLTAAIHHAPILRDMSISGFRASFLLRQGQLSVRDGSWLLRVVRETHDIVLDRFPWSTTIVKLPWMTAMMHVEW